MGWGVVDFLVQNFLGGLCSFFGAKNFLCIDLRLGVWVCMILVVGLGDPIPWRHGRHIKG